MCPAPRFSPQQQEDLVLQAAEQCIEDSSILGFTMSAISKQAGISMGSVYKHVQTKEDVLVALATRMNEQVFPIWNSVLEFPASLPERLVALVLMTPEKMNPYSFGEHLEKLISSEALLQRASKYWVNRLLKAEQRFDPAIRAQVQQAIASGELKTSEQDAEVMTLSMWALQVGFSHVNYQLQKCQWAEGEPSELYPLPVDHPLIQSTKRLLNTYSWQKPLDDAAIVRMSELLDAKGLR